MHPTVSHARHTATEGDSSGNTEISLKFAAKPWPIPFMYVLTYPDLNKGLVYFCSVPYSEQIRLPAGARDPRSSTESRTRI